MNKGRNRCGVKVRHYLQLPNMQQIKLVNTGGRNALAVICCGWRAHKRVISNSGSAMYAARLYSIQSSNQISDGLDLGFEGRLVQIEYNFTEISVYF
jgi:hypothetical protein